MKVRDVMTKGAPCANPHTTYEEVARLLHKHEVGSIAVCDGEGHLIGIVSEKDLYRAMFPEYGDFYESPHAFTNIEKSEDAIDALRERKVEEFMKKNVQTIKQDDPIMKAGGLMLAHHVHQLPVVEDGQYLGMISREDVFSAILKSHLGF